MVSMLTYRKKSIIYYSIVLILLTVCLSAVGTKCYAASLASTDTNVASGNLSHSQLLFATRNVPFSINLSLFYNSLSSYNGPLGHGWSHNYDINVKVNSDNSVTYRSGDGEQRTYSFSGGQYFSSPGDHSTLEGGVGGFNIHYRDGRTEYFGADGKIDYLSNRYENYLSFTYEDGDLTSIEDSDQQNTIIKYDKTTIPHRITDIINNNLNNYKFAYQGNNLWRVTNPTVDTLSGPTQTFWEYTYDPLHGNLQTKRNPNNSVTTYAYYNDSRMKSTTYPTGQVSTFVYNDEAGARKSTSFTDKDGGVWTYVFDTNAGVLKQKKSPSPDGITSGPITSYAYNIDDSLINMPNYNYGSIKAKTVPFGNGKRLTTFYSYDQYGNVWYETEPVDLSVYTNPTVDPESDDLASPSDFNPPINWAFGYTYDYDNNDQIKSITDMRGATPLATRYDYDYTTEPGVEIVKITDPENNVTTYRNNDDGTPKSITYANNVTTTFTSSRGWVSSATDQNGVLTNYNLYDYNGNPIQIQKFDNTGKLIVTTDNTYDALNRLRTATKTTSEQDYRIISSTKYDYDPISNKLIVTDPALKQTVYEYNYNEQVTKITDANHKETRFTYSGTGCTSCGGGVDKLTGVLDAKQIANNLPGTTYKYDYLGRLERATDPLDKIIRYTYYDNGQVKEKIDASTTPENVLVTYTYNTRGQLTDKAYPDGKGEHFTYDPNGKLRTATNHNISYTFDYYDYGRLKSVTDSTGKIISYDLYDGIGQRKQLTILKGSADQRQIYYDYDNANRPWHITTAAGKFTFDYDTLGRRQFLTYPNQIQARYDYDGLNRLNILTHQVINGPFLNSIHISWFYGNNNRDLVNIYYSQSIDTEQDRSYSYIYDNLYRLLTNYSYPPQLETFTYDDVGNRKTGPGYFDGYMSYAYQYNPANQMLTGRKLRYGYDNAGNQTSRTQAGVTDKSWTQTWDYENRLVKVEKVKGAEKRTISFSYDPLGRRIGKQITTNVDGTPPTTQTYTYVYDGENIVVEFYTDASGTTKTFYTHGPGVDEHLALERNGSFNYYHADDLGSTTKITNTNRDVVQTYEYDSFGMVKPSTNFRNSYTYTGREWDKEAGLYYYRARYYDPMEGRFIQKDPIGFAGGDINLYGYVKNNPVNYIDPSGLFYAQAQQAAAALSSFFYNMANMSPGKPVLPMSFDYASKMYDAFMDSLKTPPIDPFAPLPPGWTYDPTLNKIVPPKTPVICGGKK